MNTLTASSRKGGPARGGAGRYVTRDRIRARAYEIFAARSASG